MFVSLFQQEAATSFFIGNEDKIHIPVSGCDPNDNNQQTGLILPLFNN
jgi:hypothetical protein